MLSIFRHVVTTWPFVGRAAEIARVEALVSAGVGALLVGEAGVGKSALARNLARRARDAGRPIAIVDGRRARDDMPYEPFAAFLTEGVADGGVPARPSEIAVLGVRSRTELPAALS
jgi:Mrp family chromosome partitioning ATPase